MGSRLIRDGEEAAVASGSPAGPEQGVEAKALACRGGLGGPGFLASFRGLGPAAQGGGTAPLKSVWGAEV